MMIIPAYGKQKHRKFSKQKIPITPTKRKQSSHFGFAFLGYPKNICKKTKEEEEAEYLLNVLS